MECKKCGAGNQPGSRVCAYCGVPLSTEAAQPVQDQLANKVNSLFQGDGGTWNWSSLKPFYQAAFAEFEKNGGKMAVCWNWPAFLFGWIWYLVRGMPLKGIIYLTLGLVTSGLLWLPLMVYGGLYGTYDFYLLKAKGKQLW